MDVDFRALTGFIVIAGGAAILGLSYVAAYLMGKNAARKELDERESFTVPRPADRLDRIETAVDSIAVEVERLGGGPAVLVRLPGRRTARAADRAQARAAPPHAGVIAPW